MSYEPDELYTLRNLFWLGSYQAAINEANGLNRLNANLVMEKEEIVYRCYLAMGQANVLMNEIKDTKPTCPPSHKAIKLLAMYMSDPSKKENIKTQIETLRANNDKNPTVSLISAIFCIYDENIKEAVVHLSQESTMEQCALLVQLYLKMDRVDLAQKLVKTMKSNEEDSVLVMLCNAWIHLSMGPGKAQEAALIYDELIDKYGSSSVLLNGLAVSKMQQGDFNDAEAYLLESLTKSPMDPDTIANLVVVSEHLNRSPDVVTRYIGQLKFKAPAHSLIESLSNFDSAFERVSATLSV